MKIASQGVIPALITPLREDETVDVPSLERMLEWVLRSDIKAVFVGGTIGEGAALRDRERLRLIEESIRIVRGRIPVLVNVSDTGTVRSLENIDQAAKAGADAVIATPRLVFPARTPDSTWQYFRALAAHSPVPVWFYENPSTTPVTSTFEDIARILEIPNIGGLKYSAANPELYAKCVAAFGARIPVYNGNVPDIAFAAGLGSGALVGIGALLPGLCVRIWNAAKAGDKAKAEKLQAAIVDVYGIYGGKGWPLWPAAQKHVLKRRGIFGTSTATDPFAKLTPAQERDIDAVMAGLDPAIFDPEPAGRNGHQGAS